MARKRSSGGRARRVTPASKIYLQADKINRRIRSLERGKVFGSYKSKDLIQFARNYSTFLTLNRGIGSKRARLRIRNLREATFGQLKLIAKKFTESLRAKSFSTIGIKNIRKETRRKVKETLQFETGMELSNKDVDLFYQIINYKTDEIISRIGASEFYILVETAKEANFGVDSWVDLISGYIEINNEEMRRAAEYLYNKFVR